MGDPLTAHRTCTREDSSLVHHRDALEVFHDPAALQEPVDELPADDRDVNDDLSVLVIVPIVRLDDRENDHLGHVVVGEPLALPNHQASQARDRVFSLSENELQARRLSLDQRTNRFAGFRVIHLLPLLLV